MQRLEFTLVGFYTKAQVVKAIELFKNQLYLDGTAVSVEEAKPWLVELYPKNTQTYLLFCKKYYNNN